jgi:hypothetical protein
MNAFVERKVVCLLNQIDLLAASTKGTSDRDNSIAALLDQIDGLLSPRGDSFVADFALETLIRIPEAALGHPKKMKMAERYLKCFFRNVESEGLYEIKAHMLFAQLLAQKANEISVKSEAKMQLIRDAIQHINRAIGTITHERSRKRYAFMVYNISKVIYQMIRVYFRPGNLKEFADVVQLVNQTLTAQVEEEYDWKGFFSWLLFYCLEDTKTAKAESLQILEKLWENSKASPYFFHEALFRLRVFNSASSNQVWQSISKEAEKDPTGELKIIFALQSIRTRIIPQNQFEKELTGLMRMILPSKIEEQQKPVSNSTTDLLAEIAHTAAQNSIVQVAEKILEFLKKKQQLSSKAYVLMEFARAELLIRTKNDQTNPDKDQAPSAQNKENDIERRRDALHLITKAIKVRMGFINPMFVYEGCVKIWNFSLPFLNDKHKTEVLKSFQTAAKVLEEIQSSDFHLRIRMHYEVAKIHLDMCNAVVAEEQAWKCQRLLNFCEGAFDPKKIERLIEKINEVLRPLDSSARTILDQVAERLRGVQNGTCADVSKELGAAQRDLAEFNLQSLDAVGGNLIGQGLYLAHQIELNNISEEERPDAEKAFLRSIFYKSMVRKCSLYEEACRLSFEKNQLDSCLLLANDFVFMLSKFIDAAGQAPTEAPPVVATPLSILPSDIYFDANADQDIQISHVKILYLKAQALIKKMTDDGVDFALEELVRTGPNAAPLKNPPEHYEKMKSEIVAAFIKGAEISLRLEQTWLIFNAGILIWNAYLPVFKSVLNSSRLHHQTLTLLEFYFETLKQAVDLIEKRKIVDYDLENKVQVYGNISIIYTRLLEQQGNYSRVYSVTEDLLLVSLTPQTRKIINSIRARVGLLLKPETKGKKPAASLTNQTDQTVFEINSKLEVIANHFNGNVKQDDRLQAIKECFDLLFDFHQKQRDQLDDELLCELWTKLANLALNEEKIECTKLALSSLEFALEKSSDRDLTSLSKSKYTALAKFLYAKALCHFGETGGIEREAHEMILLKSLQMILESIDLCIKIKNSKIFEQIKKFYLIIRTIVEQFYTPENRRCIIQPIFSLVYYVKIAKDTFENFMKELELSQILVNMCNYITRGCLNKEDWEMTFMTCNLLLEICLPVLKDRIWILKVIAMTKKGVEIEKVFEEVKDCSAWLQCTLLQEIAWSADSVQVQYQAFTRAVDIVKKENSTKIFEVVLNFKEWMFRNDFPIDNIKKSLLFLERLIHKKCAGHMSGSNLAIPMGGPNDRPAPARVSTNPSPKSDIKSLDNLEFEQRDELFDYFSSGKASFPATKKLYSGVGYSADDCDNLFKVYYISSIIVQNLRERMSFVSNSIFFIWKTWYIIFEQIHAPTLKNSEIAENDVLGRQLAVMELMPKTWREWLDLDVPESFLESLPRETNKQRFCKEAYKQPLITFHYLTLILESACEYGSLAQAALLVRFLGLFTTHIMENKVAAQLATLWAAQICHIGKDTQRCAALLTKFKKEIPMTKQYFATEIEEFSRTYSDTFSKNFELNTISSKVKKTHFLNVYYVFEFWVAFGEILFSINEFPLARILLENSMSCCIKASAFELLGKCQVLLGAIHSLAGETKVALPLIESSGKNIKLLKNWKTFLLISVSHFIGNLDFVNPWKIVEKFEYLLKQLNSKDSFQYNRLHGKDVLGVLQLLKAELHIEEYFQFERNLIIECETNYCENMEKLLAETLVLFKQFLATVDNNISLRNFEILIRVLKKHLVVLGRVRVLNYEVISSAYIFGALQLMLFEKIIQSFEGMTIFLTNVPRRPATQKTETTESEFEKEAVLDEAHEYLGARLLNEVKFLRVQYINVFLSFENMYRANNYSFPAVNEKYLEEKSFGVIKTLAIVDEFLNSEENVIDDYIHDSEYKLGQNVRRSWALIYNNEKQIKKFLEKPDAFSPEFAPLLQIELDKTLVFKSNYEKELSLTKKNILAQFELTIKRKKDQEPNEEIEAGPVAGLETEYPPETLEFATFGGPIYFQFNKARCMKTIDYFHKIPEAKLVNDLIEYQDFQAKEVLFDFYLRQINPSNAVPANLKNLILRGDQTSLSAMVAKNSGLKVMMSQNPVPDNLKLLPKNSLYLILEPSPTFNDFYCGILYLSEDETQATSKFLKLKNGNSILTALKSYLRWFEVSISDNEGADCKSELMKESLKQKVEFLTQCFTEPISFILEFTKQLLESQATETNAKIKQNDKKKTVAAGGERRLGGLFIITNSELIESPLELIFEPLMERFSYCSRDISVAILASKIQGASGKITPISRADGFHLLCSQVPVANFPEIAKLNTNCKQLFAEGFDCDNGYSPDLTEIQKSLEKKRVLLFGGCIQFDTMVPPSVFLPLVGQTKLELLLCFEKVKVDRQEFKKYNSRIKQTSNYIRIRSLILQSALMNIRCSVLTASHYFSEAPNTILEFINKKTDGDLEISQIGFDPQFVGTFMFVGAPFVTLAAEAKAKGK